jgi:hypothetical protein
MRPLVLDDLVATTFIFDTAARAASRSTCGSAISSPDAATA